MKCGLIRWSLNIHVSFLAETLRSAKAAEKTLCVTASSLRLGEKENFTSQCTTIQ
jgi:hypothetical protein